MEKWCSHIETNIYGELYFRGQESHPLVMEDFNFCPICGAKKPEAPKKLAERLNQVCGWSNQVDFNVASKESLKAVEEVIDEMPDNMRCINKDDLKRRLRELV